MARRRQAGMVGRSPIRFRRTIPAAQGRACPPQALWRHASHPHECSSSPVGQGFALRNDDAFFVATAGSRTSLEGNAKKVAEIKAAARQLGREIEVYTVGQVVCRPSQKEAEDYYRHAMIENADWA